MIVGVAVFPPGEVQDFANNYRKRYDPYYALIPPHITVKEQWNCREDDLPSIVEHLNAAAADLSPFEVKLNRFSSFYPVNHVLYLAFENPEPLKTCHDRVCRGMLEEERKPYQYVPHITVGQDMTADELHDVLSSVRSEILDFCFLIDRLHLLYRTESGSWEVRETFSLK